MEIGSGHLASSGNPMCLLSRTADFEHEVAGVNQQTLISFPWDGHWQKLWDGPGCRLKTWPRRINHKTTKSKTNTGTLP